MSVMALLRQQQTCRFSGGPARNDRARCDSPVPRRSKEFLPAQGAILNTVPELEVPPTNVVP
jgi:hypothetical protein